LPTPTWPPLDKIGGGVMAHNLKKISSTVAARSG
jgi:hypothetical protein